MECEGPSLGEEYTVSVGPSLKEHQDKEENVQCNFRYDFQPASVDTSVCGLIESDANQGVVIKVAHASAAGGIEFKGTMNDTKEVDCVLIYDPHTKSFTLERLALSCTQLRHVRKGRGTKTKRN